MNTFYEHHKSSINFAYRCFDRILLNGLIQPFQQPGVDPTLVSSAAILTFSSSTDRLCDVPTALVCRRSIQNQPVGEQTAAFDMPPFRAARTASSFSSILADAINLGLTKMAEACPGSTVARHSWLSWHIRVWTALWQRQRHHRL
jgi:hypothetical protein